MADLDDKYLYLPKQYQAKHDICWGIVKELEEFLLNEKYIELSAQTFKLGENLLEELKNYEGDIFQFLPDHNKKKEHDYAVKLQLVRGVILDDSLINRTNRALHPVTSFNENNATGAMNDNS